MNKITKRDLDNFMRAYEKETKASSRMMGIGLVSVIGTLICIFLFASCATPTQANNKVTPMKKIEVNESGLRNTSHAELTKLWTNLYIQAQVNNLYPKELR